MSPVEIWTNLLNAMRADGMIAHSITATGEHTGAFIGQLSAQLSEPALTPDERLVVEALCNVAYCADVLAADGDDPAIVQATVDAIEVLEELPDDQPGYAMGPAAKAAWALRRVLPDHKAPDAFAKPDYVTVTKYNDCYVPQKLGWIDAATGYIVVQNKAGVDTYPEAVKIAALWAVELGVELRL